MATITTEITNRQFKDLDLNFIIHPVKKDINKLTNENAIVASIKHILLTSIYEKPFNPTFGSNVKNLLFDNFDMITATALTREIEQTITNYEPRVVVQNVIAKPDYDNNAYTIEMTFSIQNVTTPITINFLLKRLR